MIRQFSGYTIKKIGNYLISYPEQSPVVVYKRQPFETDEIALEKMKELIVEKVAIESGMENQYKTQEEMEKYGPF